MTADPYKELGLGHDATDAQIKRSYRKFAMMYHPDRLIRMNSTPAEMDEATTRFTAVSSAYALLTDPARKRQYDHIYKFGGFDDIPEAVNRPAAPKVPSKHTNGSRSPCNNPDCPNCRAKARARQFRRQRSRKGIGYHLYDPCTFIMSLGKNRSTSIAGIEIPSRLHMPRPSADGFRVSFTNGQINESPSGTMQYVSKTTEFSSGKSFTRVETTTVYRDGRREVVIQGDDEPPRRYIHPTIPQRSDDDLTKQSSPGDMPWYMNAWNGVRAICHNPCGAISTR